MSPAKPETRSWVSWLILALLLIGFGAIWLNQRSLLDTVAYYQYSPSTAIEDIAEQASLTESATFTFYASSPSLEASKEFNQHCQRKEADSPILGCYVGGRIFIYEISDERLAGTEIVTSAHELLHAVYERLSSQEKERITPLLKAEYEKIADKDLKSRMKYYEKTEPGESLNELHSIIGTEYANLSTALEAHYKKYFKDRAALVALHKRVDKVFNDLSQEADRLIDQIEMLASKINAAVKQYNLDSQALSAEIAAFNSRARTSGGFTTQAEFEAARQILAAKADRLDQVRQGIEADTATYKSLLAKLDAINSESSALHQSLDSVLSDAPKI